MVDSAWEQRALDRAIEEGYLTPRELEELLEGSTRLGSRLSALVKGGTLSEVVASRLLSLTAANGSATHAAAHEPIPHPQAEAGAPEDAGERFVLGEPLGHGGMGDVYRAEDRRLKRAVALKFLRGDEPERISRFLREAQAQARVDHENVCKVYEVGELDRRPFIAMQLIEGEPLLVVDSASTRPSPMLERMSTEQKARVMQKVAAGIHAAHREGLIHRDIKPGNILVERTEDGDLRPYVLDFGLAREVAAAGVSSFGLAVGTPHFMSPEQARGEAQLDRRTDVYGLGATLYAVLSGQPPFMGASSLDVLVKVTEAEPLPLRDVPEDLSTIVFKCLQKDPAQRYDSARALAEDLGRYLDGDPIHARRTSLVYRLRKRASKHKRLLAVASVAALAVLATAAAGLRAQWRGRETARLAALFGEEVKGIENRLRIAQLAPEHDVSKQKAAIRESMTRLAAQVQRLGPVAEGPGAYALGRGSLALKEYTDARTSLQRAWDVGYRPKEVSYALGQVLGAQYQRELRQLDAVSDKKKKEEKRKELEQSLRDPALRHLREARGLDLDSPEYAEALIAFHELRDADALAKAKAAYEALPWLYEARVLEAQVHTRQAEAEVNGGRYAEARAVYAQAEASYREALQIGRSDSSIPEGLCRLAPWLMQVEMYGGASAVEPYFQRGLDECERAIRIDRESADAQLSKSYLLWRAGENETRQGRDPRAHLTASIEAGREALRLRPNDDRIDRILYSLGVAFCVRGQWEQENGLDPRESFVEAARHLEQGLQRQPSDIALLTVHGIVRYLYAGYEARHGRDAEAPRRESEATFRKAMALQPDNMVAKANLGMMLVEEAWDLLVTGGDPRGPIERTLGIASTHPICLTNRGEALLVRAEYEMAHGLRPEQTLAEAEKIRSGVLAVNAKYPPLFVQMARAELLEARLDLERGRDLQPALEEARRAAARALASGHRPGPVHLIEARLSLLEARHRVARGLDPAAAVARARASLDKAVRVDPEDPAVHAAIAEASRWAADWERRQGRTAAAEVTRGLASVEKALLINPRYAEALALRSTLQALRGPSPRT
jgi:eukaryotic-like serine/threonine-protein kinase